MSSFHGTRQVTTLLSRRRPVQTMTSSADGRTHSQSGPRRSCRATTILEFSPVDPPTVADDVIHNRDRRRLSLASGRGMWAVGDGRAVTSRSLASRYRNGRFAYRRFWADVGEQFPDLAGAASTHRILRGERAAAVHRAFRPDLDRAPSISQDRSLGRGQEHAHPRVGQPRRARAPTASTSPSRRWSRRAPRSRPPARVAPAGRGRRRARPAVPRRQLRRRSTRWAPSSTSTKPSGRSRRWRACSSPAGRAIVGVPNRHDPFLRPLFATVLQAVGLTATATRSRTRAARCGRCSSGPGLEVVAETAILFIPGWLRMLDLACHSWCRPLAAVTGALVRPFVLLDRHVPAVRRHGYLLATVVRKPH